MKQNLLTLAFSAFGAIVAIGIALAALPTAAVRDAAAAPAPKASPFAGAPLPEGRLFFTNGDEVPPEEIRRGRVLLVFLTTNCEPCVEEAQLMSRLAARAPADLRILGVGIERASAVELFRRDFGLTYPILIDGGSRMREALKNDAFPHKYLVEDGTIVRDWLGATRPEALPALCQELGIPEN